MKLNKKIIRSCKKNGNSILERGIDYGRSIFCRISDQEFILIVGVAMTFALCFCAILPNNVRPALVIGALLTLAQYIIYTLRAKYYSKRCTSYRAQEIIFYECNLDEMIFILYDQGLRLKKKIGEYYIFTTNWRILSNCEFVVKENLQFCTLQAKAYLIEELNKCTTLVELKSETTKNYKDTTNNA